MTQILGVVTHDYALLASDRRLSFVGGPRAGQVADDNACKLVSLCNIMGIAYTGLAVISGMPTHEWIALRLAEHGCTSPTEAGEILKHYAAVEVPRTRYTGEQTFLFAGWDWKVDEGRLRPRLGLVTNKHGSTGATRPQPSMDFCHFTNWLTDDRKWAAKLAGQDMSEAQVRHQRRLYNRLVATDISPRTVLEHMARAVSETAMRNSTVGSRVLCMCLPRAGVEQSLTTGQSMLLAGHNSVDAASFTYYDQGYSELQQYGPSTVCGQSALTGLITESDPSEGRQSVQVRILHMPSEPQ